MARLEIIQQRMNGKPAPPKPLRAYSPIGFPYTPGRSQNHLIPSLAPQKKSTVLKRQGQGRSELSAMRLDVAREGKGPPNPLDPYDQ